MKQQSGSHNIINKRKRLLKRQSLSIVAIVALSFLWVMSTMMMQQQQRRLFSMFTFQGEGGWGNTTTTNTTTATTTMQRTKNHQLQHQNNNSNNNNQRRRQRPKTIPSRVFSKWNGSTTLPCFPPTDIVNNTHNNNNNNTQQHQQQLQFLHWTDKRNLKRPATDGLFFLKLLKTGSTTASSIHVRIAYNLARRRRRRRHRQWNNHTNATTAVTTTTTTSSTTTSNNEYYYPICATRHLHGWAGPRMYHYGQRHAATSLLWTILREPTARYLSEFFHFQVSRRAGTPVSRAIISYLRSGPHSDHHYLSWLSTRRSYNARRRRGRGRPYVIAQQILQDYDFIGITERMDESAVALMMLLPQEQISMADILYLNSKTAGGYDDGAYGNTCVKIRPVEISAELQAYLDSPEWKAYIAPEEALYRAVNQSLDRTIDALGRFEFERNLKRFRHAQRVVQETCAPVVKFPCSLTGELRAPEETDCLHGDVGCGFDCLDKVATELELW